MISPSDVLEFWFEEVGSDNWYEQSDVLDEEIRRRFEWAWKAARNGAYDHWLVSAEGALALIVLLDQFPRNMYRGDAAAYQSDRKAVCAAKRAISRSFDLKIDEPARQFFYLPLMHSENLVDQDRCIRLIAMRMPETGSMNLPHAVQHRDVIRKFGRFPSRNQALRRLDSPAERAYREDGGYMSGASAN